MFYKANLIEFKLNNCHPTQHNKKNPLLKILTTTNNHLNLLIEQNFNSVKLLGPT